MVSAIAELLLVRSSFVCVLSFLWSLFMIFLCCNLVVVWFSLHHVCESYNWPRRKVVSEITHNVSSRMWNPTMLYHHWLPLVLHSSLSALLLRSNWKFKTVSTNFTAFHKVLCTNAYSNRPYQNFLTGDCTCYEIYSCVIYVCSWCIFSVMIAVVGRSHTVDISACD